MNIRLRKRIIILVSILLSFILTSCGVNSAGSLIKVENMTDQFEKMTEELQNLKTIKVKTLDAKRYEEMREIIYQNYFSHKEDESYTSEESYEGENCTVHDLTYQAGEFYERLLYADNYVRYDGESLFDEKSIDEVPAQEIMEQETEKLFQLLDLPFGDSVNGYMMDSVTIDGKRASVVVKRYIEGRELSTLPVEYSDLKDVECIVIYFAGNKIAGINLYGLTEPVSVTTFKGEILVNTTEKAYRLIDDYIRSTTSSYVATEEGTRELEAVRQVIEKARITYAVQSQNDGTSVLSPVAEFTLAASAGSYHIDLTTKEIVPC